MLLAATVVARGATDRFEALAEPLELRGPAEALGSRRIFRAIEGEAVEAMIYAASALHPGASIRGPAIIEGPLTTIQLPPDWQLEVDGYGNLMLTDNAGERSEPVSDRRSEVLA